VKGNGVGEPISNFTPARPTSVKSLAGDFVYGYDEANPALLTKMTGPAHSVETSYEPHRNLVTGVVNRVLIQSAARRTDEDTKGKVVSSYTYSNDLLGRRETISQGGEAFGMLKLGHNQVEVAYNDRSEVVGAVYRSGDEARQTFDYAYDAIGNRRTAVSSRVTGQESREEKVSYETNALNQYTAIDERSSSNPKSEIGNPKFDPDGNLLEDARNTYTWNADNNLVRVDAKDGSLRLDYVYDHQSRRTVRTETTNPETKNEAQKTTYYLYDAWNLLAEIDAVPAGGELGTLNFEPATLFSWGRDLSGSLQGAGGVGGLLAITKRNAITSPEQSTKNQERRTDGETRFAIFDANGNIGQLIDRSGTVVAAYTYDPFGNVTEMAGAEAAENPWRFSTKPVEAGTGWLYYGYRWYDAENGRWPSRDPIEESGGLNLYGFVGNQTMWRVDSLGQNPFPGPGVGDQINPFGLRGDESKDYNDYFENRFQESIQGALSLLRERIEKEICKGINSKPRLKPKLVNVEDVDIRPDGKRFGDPPQGFMEKNFYIGYFEIKSQPVDVTWKSSCSYEYASTAYVEETTGANPPWDFKGPGDIFGLTPFFIQRKVRMAEWDLSAVGKKCPDCCDDAFRARLPN
jgi:RHS repeat-associated protein